MKKDTSKSTLLIIVTGFLILFLVFSWNWAIYVSLAVGLAGSLSGRLGRMIEKAWMQLGRMLSLIIPSLLLGLVFCFILFPVSLVSRLFNKDSLKLSDRYPSYFADIDKEAKKEDFEKIW